MRQIFLFILALLLVSLPTSADFPSKRVNSSIDLRWEFINYTAEPFPSTGGFLIQFDQKTSEIWAIETLCLDYMYPDGDYNLSANIKLLDGELSNDITPAEVLDFTIYYESVIKPAEVGEYLCYTIEQDCRNPCIIRGSMANHYDNAINGISDTQYNIGWLTEGVGYGYVLFNDAENNGGTGYLPYMDVSYNPKTINADIDLNTMPGNMTLFIICFSYFALLILAYLMRSFMVQSFAFFIGIVLGFTLFELSFWIGLFFVTFNTLLFFKAAF